MEEEEVEGRKFEEVSRERMLEEVKEVDGGEAGGGRGERGGRRKMR